MDGEIRLIEANREKCAPGHSCGPGIKSTFMLHFIVSGKGFFIKDNVRYNLVAGNGFLIRPNEIIYYEADDDEPWEYYWIGLDGEGAENFFKRLNLSDSAPIYRGKGVADIKYSLQKLISQFTGDNEYFKLYELLFSLGNSLYVSNEEKPVVDLARAYVERAKSYIYANFYKAVTIADISAFLSIERTYLYKLFIKYEKISPQEFVMSHKMEFAKNALLSSNATIKEIAYSVGYCDSFSFSKQFTKYFGVSPLNFKKSSK